MEAKLLRMAAVAATWILTTGSAFGQSEPTYLTKNIYKQGGKIHFVTAHGHESASVQREARVLAIEDGEVSGPGYNQFGDHVALHKRNPQDGSLAFRVFGPGGSAKGELRTPPGKVPVLMAESVYVVQRSLHSPVIPHEISFYSLEGRLLNRASDSTMSLIHHRPQSSGHLVTLNRVHAGSGMLVRIYDIDGARLWDYPLPEGMHAQLTSSPDGTKLLVADQSLDGTVVIVSQTGPMATNLPVKRIWEVGFSPDSRRLALVADNGLTVFDLETGELEYSKRGRLTVFRNSLEFDESGRYLYLLVAAEVEGDQLSRELREIDLNEGSVRKKTLPNVSRADPGARVFGVQINGRGNLRITFLNQVEVIESNDWE